MLKSLNFMKITSGSLFFCLFSISNKYIWKKKMVKATKRFKENFSHYLASRLLSLAHCNI